MDELGPPRPGPASRGEPGGWAERPYGSPYYHQPQPSHGGLRFSYLLLGLIAILALAFAAAPFWAFRSLRSAAVYGDAAALAELVDYGAVRASLAPQLGPAPAATRPPPPDFLRDPLGAFRRQMEPQAKPADIDAYLSPQALARISLGMDHAGPAPPRAEGPLPALRFWDGRRVRFSVADPADRERETVLTMQRRGWFGWRLVAVTLPG